MKTVSTTEAARRLFIHRRTVLTWLHNGKLTGTQVGKMWRVNEDSLLVALQHHQDFFGCTEDDCAWGCAGWRVP